MFQRPVFGGRMAPAIAMMSGADLLSFKVPGAGGLHWRLGGCFVPQSHKHVKQNICTNGFQDVSGRMPGLI